MSRTSALAYTTSPYISRQLEAADVRMALDCVHMAEVVAPTMSAPEIRKLADTCRDIAGNGDHFAAACRVLENLGADLDAYAAATEASPVGRI